MKIYIDTREKQQWSFNEEEFEIERLKLDTGDYYVEELPDMVIERKRTTGELATNLGRKWKQFEAELKRMQDYKYAYIICEFPIQNLDIYPEKSGLTEKAKAQTRMNPGFIKSRFFGACSLYNITPLFFNNSNEARECFLDLIKTSGKYGD